MQRLPLDQAHVDVELAVDFAPVMDRDDMGFLQNRRGMRLALKSGAVLLVF